MPIVFECPHCQSKLKTADQFAGRKTKCLNCRQVVVIPSSPQEGGERAESRQRRRPVEPEPSEGPPPFRKIGLRLPAWVAGVASLPAWLALGMFALTLLLFPEDAHRRDTQDFLLGAMVCSLPAVAAGVWFLVGMYRAWAHVISWSRRARIRPPVYSAGAAIGFLFIPFYNLWWAWRFYGIARDLNRIIDKEDLDAPYAPAEIGSLMVGLMYLGGAVLAASTCFPPVYGLGVLCGMGTQACLISFAHGLQRSLNAVGEELGGAE